MGAMRGYYSLVQYCPDPSRAEAANLGVILFCPERDRLDIRLSDSNRRVQTFFGRQSFDAERLTAAKQALKNRIEDHAGIHTLAEMERFAASRGNDLIVTAPRPVRVDDPAKVLQSLFEALVESPPAPEQKGKSVAFQRLDTVFKALAEAGRARLDEKVIVPVTGRELKIPYAYQNGVENLITPQQFSAQSGSALGTAERLAISGDQLRKHSESDRRLVVVADLQGVADAAVQRQIAGLFKAYEVKLVRATEIDAFLQQVEREAH